MRSSNREEFPESLSLELLAWGPSTALPSLCGRNSAQDDRSEQQAAQARLTIRSVTLVLFQLLHL
jgi:hypothetical protein